MIEQISIQNFKSVQELTLPLGRINVLIGANGVGKSNILEAIAFASAAVNSKLDNEYLAARGIRVTDDARLMKSVFDKSNLSEAIRLTIRDQEHKESEFLLQSNEDSPYSAWTCPTDPIRSELKEIISSIDFVYQTIAQQKEQRPSLTESEIQAIVAKTELGENGQHNIARFARRIGPMWSYLIYSPEYTKLRAFAEEGQILPLGINGEGLFKLLKVMANASDQQSWKDLKEHLTLLEWFGDFDIPSDLTSNERTLKVKDRYLDESLASIDQRSSNEGFLFLLFYYSLFISDLTPPFFAIDNIDASLNPRLCSQLMEDLAKLAAEHNKQAILTTHNPAILDGINLHDDDQRLFVVSRNGDGHTRIKRVHVPVAKNGKTPVRLSEAFMRGYLGGLPGNF